MLKTILRRGFGWLRYKIRAPEKQIRKDMEIIPVQPNLDLIVYWKDLKIGKGPAAVLRAYNKEILKFDCFGIKKGHYHAAPDYGKRIFFEEETVEEQIGRMVDELNDKAQVHLNNQKPARIRNIKIESENMKKSTEIARVKMTEFLKNVPELQDLR